MFTYMKQLFRGDEYPIYIVAGNFQEFQNFVIKKRQMGFHFEYRYVNSVDSIRGLDRIVDYTLEHIKNVQTCHK